jgi:hypothetical protein
LAVTTLALPLAVLPCLIHLPRWSLYAPLFLFAVGAVGRAGSDSNEATVTIPAGLAGLGARFIRLNGKVPIDKDWTNPSNWRTFNDPVIQEHLKAGGNYGFVCGEGIIAIDSDDPDLTAYLKERLQATWTDQTPGHGGLHFLFKCNINRSGPLRDKNGKHVGDLQGPGKQIVGPNSIHPDNGQRYVVVNDAPLAEISSQQLLAVLKPYLIPEKETERIQKAAQAERGTFPNLNMALLIPANMKRRGSELFGVHPIHGSETGRNFHVNESLQVWHCFRHGTGGGAWSLFAMEQGLITCEEATPGALRGKKFKELLKLARAKGLVPDVARDPVSGTSNAPSPEVVETVEFAIPSTSSVPGVSPLLSKIVDLYQKLGLVGEARNITQIWLTLETRHLPRGFRRHVIPHGESGSGKSTVARTILKPFMFDVESYSRLTGPGLDRKTNSMDGKILFVEQIGGNEPGQLKFLMSEGELSLLYAERDETGRIVSKTHHIEGMPVVVSTLVGAYIDAQLLNRVSTPEIDDSDQQTGSIIKRKLTTWATVTKESPESILKQLQWLDKRCSELGKRVLDVKIPFAIQLEEKLPKVLAMRRGLDRIASLVACVAFVKAAVGLRAFVELERTEGPNVYVIAMPEDLTDALFCLGSALAESVTLFFGKAKKIYEHLCANALANNSTRQVARSVGLSQNRAREYLNLLVDLGYATIQKEKQTFFYEAIAKDPNLTLNLDASFTTEDLQDWFDKEFVQTEAKLVHPSVVIGCTPSEPEPPTVQPIVPEMPTIEQTEPEPSLDDLHHITTADTKNNQNDSNADADVENREAGPPLGELPHQGYYGSDFGSGFFVPKDIYDKAWTWFQANKNREGTVDRDELARQFESEWSNVVSGHFVEILAEDWSRARLLFDPEKNRREAGAENDE